MLTSAGSFRLTAANASSIVTVVAPLGKTSGACELVLEELIVYWNG